MKKTEKKATVIIPEVVEGGTYSELVNAIGGLLERARSKIATVANFELVKTNWETGRYIVEYEQHGADRAKYGTNLLKSLARDLTLRYGRGFNRNGLQYMRKLYRTFPKCTTLSCKLSWSHYLEILKCGDDLVVQFATEGITNKIFVSRYQLYLPDKEQLRRELARAIEEESRRANPQRPITRRAKKPKATK